jgi:hypothetical protein
MARFSSDRGRSGRARRPGRSSRVRLRGHEQRFVRGGSVSAPGASVQATILNTPSELRASLGPTMVLRDRGPGPRNGPVQPVQPVPPGRLPFPVQVIPRCLGRASPIALPGSFALSAAFIPWLLRNALVTNHRPGKQKAPSA